MQQYEFTVPAVTRSKMILETVSEMVGENTWEEQQVKVNLRRQGGDSWPLTLFASDTPGAIEEVASGRAQIAIINPAEPLTLALRGTGPFPSPVPLRTITVIPSDDQLAFAVMADTGLTSLEDIRERRFPLKVSLRGQPDHSLHLFSREVLRAAGFSLEDVTSWGGQVRYDRGMPDGPNRIGAVQRGEINGLFDEAVNTWVNEALDLGMRVLPLGEPLLQKLEALGFRRASISKRDYPKLPADVPTLDFSGWPVYTRADVADDLITAFCAALEARKDRIPWQGYGSLPLERMCRDAQDTPLTTPLHPAAERYWRERGYLN